MGNSSRFVPGQVGRGQAGGAWWAELGESPSAGQLARRRRKRKREEVRASSELFFDPEGQTDRWPGRQTR